MIQKTEICEAFEDVRDDSTPTTWLCLKYDGNNIVLKEKGDNYDDLLEQFGEDERAYAFVRVIMGDELSKRAKFALITWTGPSVSVIKKAKMSTDKAEVKSVITSFAAEITADSREEVTLEVVKDRLLKAGGANYGTGARD
ncbi:coactosin-like protein [Babylonia areolata]|uniref:coactosin-like protein n=1 Tax=Babylonia areolata TaxID=304850 RepID=UPI003FD1F7C8